MAPRLLEFARVGVYAGDQWVHAAEVVRGLRGRMIVRAGSARIDPAEPDAFVAALKRALREAGITRRDVALALKGSDTFLRYFEMPLLPRLEWAKGARFESQKYAPFPVAEMASGFRVSPDSFSKKMRVAFAGARKSTVAAVTAAVKRAGLTPVSIEPLAFAVQRAYSGHGKPALGGCEMLLHADPGGSASAIIVKEGLPLFVRHSALSGAAPSYEDLFSEVRMAVDYFSKYFKSEKLARIVLCGLDAAWADRFAQEFAIPAITEPGIESAGKAAAGPGVSCAAGAALGGLALGGRDVNFVQAGPAAAVAASGPLPAGKLSLSRAAGAAALVLALAVGFGYFSLAASHNTLRAESGRLDAAMRRLVPDWDSPDAPPLELRLQDLEQKNSFVNSLVGERVLWTEKMNRIARFLPDSARLTRADYNDDENARLRSLTLEGVIEPGAAPDAVDIVNRFVAALGADKEFMRGFEDAKIGYIRADTESAGPSPAYFSVTCRSAAVKLEEPT